MGKNDSVHFLMKPALALMLTYIEGAISPKVVERREKGFDQQLAKDYYEAMMEAYDEINEYIFEENEEYDEHLKKAMRAFINISSLVFDSERHYFPIWWNAVVKALRRRGLLDEMPEPKQLKTKVTKDEHGVIVYREVIQDDK